MLHARTAWLAAIAVVVSTGGFALGATGVVDLSHERRAAVAVPGATAYYACPGQVVVGAFHGGDRVFLTARNDAGDWVMVRDPHAPDLRVWVAAAYVDADSSVAALPAASCELPAALKGEGTTIPTGTTPATTALTSSTPISTTTSVVPSSTTSTTAIPTTTSVAVPSTTVPPPTSTSRVPSTTVPQDVTPPTIGAVTAEPTRIYENASSCIGGTMTSTLTFPVTDTGSGVKSVRVTSSVAGRTDEWRATAGPTTWSAVIGPFPSSTLSGGEAVVTVTIVVTDAAGNTASRTDASVTLRDCG